MLVRHITSTQVVIDAPAKVNLFLQVLSRRPDGYHNINSLVQAVSLFDRLRFNVAPNPEVSIDLVHHVDLPLGADNMIAKAYRLMKEQFGLTEGLLVTLDKNIPVSAGLGGGSADGAAAILACNLLFDLKLSYSQMAELALDLGSDVPFFLSCGQALVSGRGEIVMDTDFPTDYRIVLVSPDIAVSTASSYAALKTDLTKPKTPFKLKRYRTVDKFVRSLRFSGNDFENVQLVSFPELGRIKDTLLKRGALLARMSGSGPTMFGIFTETPKVEVAKSFNREGWRFYTVEPISLPGQDQLVRGRHRENHGGPGNVAGQGEA